MTPYIPKYILEETYEREPKVRETLRELGYDIYAEFNTLALTKMMEVFDRLGYKELADRLYREALISEAYWAERAWRQTGQVIAFDFTSKRWRDMITGRFVKSPYTYLWED